MGAIAFSGFAATLFVALLVIIIVKLLQKK